MPPPPPTSRFPLTQWTVMVRVCQTAEGSAAREKALAEFCQDYWYPLYAFARRAGHSQHDAEDLTQSFFRYFLANNILSAADRGLGRLRTFLLAVFRRHIGDEIDRRMAVKRGGRQCFVSLDLPGAEEQYAQEPQDPATPESLFERSWALQVLRGALRSLEEEEQQAGRGATLVALRPFLDPESAGCASTAEAAARLGLSADGVRQAVSRLRRRFRDALRRHISATLRDPSETQIDDELAALQAALR